jgi:mRNA-degrading endonuclease RelE of RelBE toxin-antitoxin system
MGRSRRQRKRFGCGHRGFGRYCHCCAEREAGRRRKIVERDLSKRVRLKEHVVLGWDLSKFSQGVRERVKDLVTQLRDGVNPGALGGKRLVFNRGVVRIPVGYRYRLLCRWDKDGIEPMELLSHEDYNPRVRGNRL